jgi:Ca2+-binding EF-hand superfamily protein
MMIKKHLPLAVLLLAALPAVAAPDPEGAKPPRSPNAGMMRYDANNDGWVDRAEWDAGQQARFRQLDTDKDGKLTKAELFPRSGRADDRQLERQDRHFRRMDRDHDGFVSLAEFMAQAERNFARCDADKDGRTNAAECRQALRRQPVERARDQR